MSRDGLFPNEIQRAMATDLGLPTFSIRFKILHAMSTSFFWAVNSRA